ncbi:MAG: hypothetical protein ACRDPS_08095 [Nocardioides sp.]|uniref:hypothetical protein n=1 Tax=Nocardioides sp. TaxID=35761 RepID=UPI003D6A38B4
MLLAGVFVAVLSPGPAQAGTDSWAHWTATFESTDAAGLPSAAEDERPPATPDRGQPTDASRQSSVPDTGGPSWVFAGVGAALMLAGTALSVKARRGNRKLG